MRIRKYAKLAGLKLSNTLSSTYLCPQTPLQPHICHLNQSPWDVISFPPDLASSPFQLDGDDSFIGNWSFGDSFGIVQSQSVVSMKMSMVGEEKIVKNDVPKEGLSDLGIENIENTKDIDERKDQQGANKKAAFFCCRSDGKGWRCKKRAPEGYPLCEHHLAQLKTYHSLAHPTGKKSEKPAVKFEPIYRSPHPKSAAFCFGFEPRRAKKRGTTVEPFNINDNKPNVINAAIKATTSSSPLVDNEFFNYVEDDDNNKNAEDSGEF